MNILANTTGLDFLHQTKSRFYRPLVSIRLSIIILFFAIVGIVFSSCTGKKIADLETPFNPLVAAFTSGTISSESYIRIHLSADYPGIQEPGTPVNEKILSFSPAIKGTAWWNDLRTIEFRPDNPLPSGTSYNAELLLSSLFKDKKDIKNFKFSFKTIPLNVDVVFEGLKTYSKTDLSLNEIKGKLVSTDRLSVDYAEKLLIARQNNRNLPLRWTHQEDGKVHFFTVDSVQRTQKRESVTISWENQSSGQNIKDSREYIIPSLGEFTLMEQRIIQQPEQYILLSFSDPLKANQQLEGLIHLENNTNLRFSIEENVVKVYPVIRQKGSLNIFIEPGILNVLGFKFTEKKSFTLNFESLKPSIRLIGSGVIIPQSEGLLFPFEAVNLNTIDVKIIRIFEDNVAQFLQVNSLDGSYELKRAGRLVAKKTIDLVSGRPINYGEWNAFSLDLAQLVETEPGAIYRVELSFKRSYSLYDCPGQEPAIEEMDPDRDRITENDLAYYDSNSYYDYDYYEDYEWSEREDPCSDSYYMYDNRVARNVLASNIGIIAKAGNDKSMLFAVTDLRTTEPIKDVSLNIYNFQQQLIASLLTDKDGIAKVILESQPYLLIAKKDEQRGYLRLDPGSSLSLSQFDIQGASVSKGIKGFIYGERGVWRPGDSIFLNFILEDKQQNLPENHPVTLELFNPMGKKVSTFISASGLNGFYSFHFPTSQDAPTGTWNAKISVGNLVFNKYLRIETIKPNRLKTELDFKAEELRSDLASITGEISSNWLHGAPASNLKATVSVNFKSIPTTFAAYSGYVFTDPSRSFMPLEQEIFSGVLSSEGKASIKAAFTAREQSPGKVNAIFTTRVFEKGGDFSTTQHIIPYSPYPSYTGLKAPGNVKQGVFQTDTSYRFEVVTLGEAGNPLSASGLQVKIYKLDWKWWWHSENENLASYIGSSFYKPVFEKNINTSNGKAFFDFKVDYPEWGRFFIRVYDPKSKHSSGQIVYFDWPGWAGRSDRKDPSAASILTFSSGKSKYSVGETATITIPTGEGGRALISIENGTRVIDHHWIKSMGGETTFSFTVTKEMTPNIYVCVSLIQPHKQTANDLPVRMYGVIPILVEDAETHLDPVLKMPDVIRPESVIDITVSESKGREMTYTIAMVDEGLLDLTRFTTPDPWNYFYAREALGVKLFDLYDMVLGAYGGRIDGVFSIGGDDEVLVDKGADRAKRFPPVVRFIGPFHLSANKSQTHKINITNYVGSVKTMVVAGYKGAYGFTEKVTPVKNPLMILATLPRVLGPSESVNLPVTVFAMEDNIKNVDIVVETNEAFQIIDGKKTVNFERIGDATIDLALAVREKTGIGKVRVIATSGKERAVYDIEIDIRSPNPPVTQYVYGIAEPGESWSTDFILPGMKGTNTGILEVSSLPPVDFGRRLKFLISYPHGCAEQIISGAFPQLYLADVMDTDENMKEMIKKNVQAAIQKISSMQLPGGGIGYWPGATLENDWGTSYAGHFMLEAKTKGFFIPDAFLKNWLRHQKKTARNWTGSAYQSEWDKQHLEMAQAYRLYTLALAGEAETGAMNRLRERPGVKNTSLWRLAAAYVLAGQPELARKISENLTTSITNYSDPGYTYGSPLRDMAMILEAMVLTGEREKAIPLLQEVSEKLSSESWYSTQTTAFSLIAVSKFAGGSNTSKELKYDFSIHNNPLKHAAAKTPFSRIDHVFDESGNSNVKIVNKGEGLIYARMALHGIPAAGQEKSYSSNLSVSVEYLDMQGKPVNVEKLNQGTDFLAIVSVHNPGTLGNYKDMALVQIFPSGWEIQNLRLFEANLGAFSSFDYQDFRDDRVNTYFSIGSGKQEKFAVKLNAAYKGRFYLPAVSCEAMYRNDIAALKEGMWVEVVEAGKP